MAADLQKARQHLITQRRYYIEQLARRPVMTEDLIRWIFDAQRAIDVLDWVELTPVPRPEVLHSELQLAREYLIARRGYYIEELAKRPAVIDELIRGIFDAQRAIDVLDRVELEKPHIKPHQAEADEDKQMADRSIAIPEE